MEARLASCCFYLARAPTPLHKSTPPSPFYPPTSIVSFLPTPSFPLIGGSGSLHDAISRPSAILQPLHRPDVSDNLLAPPLKGPIMWMLRRVWGSLYLHFRYPANNSTHNWIMGALASLPFPWLSSVHGHLPASIPRHRLWTNSFSSSFQEISTHAS